MTSDNDHRASYDEDGNIILPSGETSSPEDADGEVLLEGVWTTVDDDSEPQEQESAMPGQSRLTRHARQAERTNPLQTLHVHTRNTLFGLVNEGASQYRWSARSIRRMLLKSASSVRGSAAAGWSFLTQPVWVMHRRRNRTKQYNRLTLFLLDTVRFGGTFAALFVALFVSLNYQSFWQITQSYINPIHRVQSGTSSAETARNALSQKLLRSPALATAGSDNGNLLSFLPTVGPPENRIIIPKLGLNVPLVTPSYQALLNEDWGSLEEDIQDALQMGVVHYPGTARPGQAGNFFVTGHSSYYPWAPGDYKTIFARLTELEPGDEYWVYYGGDKYRYIIRNKKEVKPTNVNVLDQPVSKRISTLMTCTPIGTTLRRLIITAEEVDPITGNSLAVGENHKKPLPKINVESLPI